jgi:spore photoproduct lyase
VKPDRKGDSSPNQANLSRPPVYPNFREGKSRLEIVEKKGKALDTCATIGNAFVCCNVKVLKSIHNCPFDCSYCFLQNYLTDGTTKVIGNIDAIMAEVDEQCRLEPNRFFRIGNWELGDSLALETETGHSRQLIEAFSKRKNVVLELKTKSDCVDSILDCDHQYKTVVSWSLNPDEIIKSEEHRTACLADRILAIKKVAEVGYPIGLHFDPMIYYPDWQNGYSSLIAQLFDVISANQIAWISIGSLRFNPEQKEKMEANFPRQTLTASEMVLAPDNKIRYVKPLRIEMYQFLYNLLCNACQINSLSPTKAPHPNRPILYFCMERQDIYQKVMGDHPQRIAELDYLFAFHMFHRFQIPGLSTPDPSYYTDSHNNQFSEAVDLDNAN